MSIIYDCTNPKCRFSCLTLSLSEEEKICPVCGSKLKDTKKNQERAVVEQ